MKRKSRKKEGPLLRDKSPSYLSLSDEVFQKKIKHSKEILSSCTLCSNNCKVNRHEGQIGKCGLDSQLKISSSNLHFGEEPPISGKKGSGTVFLTGCCMFCVFCQNYPISQLNNGRVLSPEELGDILIKLQRRGAHNINFVSPTHQVPQIVESIHYAKKKGLKIPIVYNTGGYDSLEALSLLKGIVDIYLPDFKYADDNVALKYSGVTGYFATASKAIKEMHNQTGNIQVDERGIAYRGLMIRHLVLPGGLAGTAKVFKQIKGLIGTEVYISLMNQFFPAYKSHEMKMGKLKKAEYEKAREAVLKLKFENVYEQVENEGLSWEDFCRKEAI